MLNTLGWIHSEKGALNEALTLNQEALKLALLTGDPETIHNAEINVGENHLQLGNLERAGKILSHVRGKIQHKRYLYAGWRYRTRLLIALGELHGKRDAHEMGLKFINQALKMAHEHGSAKHEARALQVKAGIIFKSRPKIAISYLEKARELSMEMGAKLLLQRIQQTMEDLQET